MPADADTPQRRFALDVLRKLRQAGFQALWAGGCVRDQLLGFIPKDYDVATDATPDEVLKLFGRRTRTVGAAFGVVLVHGPREAGYVEVATFRQDAPTSDGRRPDHVIFSTPEADARRRDFTINGLFYDPVAGEVIDYVDGQADLRRGLIRAIGEPRARFTEDKLRMLRAVRFAAVFGFAVEPATLHAIQSMADEVTIVSAERIGQEMKKLLLAPERVLGARLLVESRLAEPVLPEWHTLAELPWPARPGQSAWDEALETLGALEAPTVPLALAALLAPLGRRGAAEAHAAVERIAERWRLSNQERDRTAVLVARADALAGAAQQPWSRLQRVLVHPSAEELLELVTARARAAGARLDDVEYCRLARSRPPDDLDPPPLLTGHDLLAHGVPQGAVFGFLLELVRTAQLDGQIAARAEALALVDRWLAERAAGGAAESS